jgi:DNA-binding LacI/PurR family transcriptional regulator
VGKRVTIKEVAARAGVSYQTVSKVINRQIEVTPETTARIWDAVSELGYRPNYTARSLRSQRSRTIGYSWSPAPYNETNPILDEFLQSMFKTAELDGYYLLCFPFHEDRDRQIEAYSELIDTGRVDGFILSSIEYNDARVELLLERGFPFVGFGRSNDELVFPYIDVDGGQGLYEAVMHLAGEGRRRIAALAWPEDSRVGNNRMAGYFRGMADAGLSVDPQLVLRGLGNFEYGFEAAEGLLQLPAAHRPDALVALNDYMAIGAMAALRKHGLTPGEEIAVTGFDDNPIARYLQPSSPQSSSPSGRLAKK